MLDIGTVVEELKARGVLMEQFEGLVQSGLGIWASPSGAKVACLKEPDGNLLSITQYGNRK